MRQDASERVSPDTYSGAVPQNSTPIRSGLLPFLAALDAARDLWLDNPGSRRRPYAPARLSEGAERVNALFVAFKVAE